MKTVPMSRQYTIGSAVFEAVTFREPKQSDYRQIGKVIELQRDVVVTYDDAIWAYADRLVQEIPHGALGELDLVDTLAVEAQIIDFFTAANKLLRKRESLSSASDGGQPT